MVFVFYRMYYRYPFSFLSPSYSYYSQPYGQSASALSSLADTRRVGPTRTSVFFECDADIQASPGPPFSCNSLTSRSLMDYQNYVSVVIILAISTGSVSNLGWFVLTSKSCWRLITAAHVHLQIDPPQVINREAYTSTKRCSSGENWSNFGVHKMSQKPILN